MSPRSTRFWFPRAEAEYQNPSITAKVIVAQDKLIPAEDEGQAHNLRVCRVGASALIRKQKLKKDHYSPDIAVKDWSDQQDQAHHAFVGGRIEPLIQGNALDRRAPILPRRWGCQVCAMASGIFGGK